MFDFEPWSAIAGLWGNGAGMVNPSQETPTAPPSAVQQQTRPSAPAPASQIAPSTSNSFVSASPPSLNPFNTMAQPNMFMSSALSQLGGMSTQSGSQPNAFSSAASTQIGGMSSPGTAISQLAGNTSKLEPTATGNSSSLGSGGFGGLSAGQGSIGQAIGALIETVMRTGRF